MKKQLLSMALLCAIALASKAQTEKGKNLIGGSVGFSSSKNDADNFTQNIKSYGIEPNFGHFFSDNFVIGLRAGFNQNKNTNSNDYNTAANGTIITSTITNETKQNSFAVGPFVRYYVNILDRFKFFGQFNAGIGFGKNRQYTNVGINPISESKFTNYNASVNPGLAFFPTKRWAVELGFGLLSYSRVTQKYENQPLNKTTSDSFYFGLSTLSPNLGVNYHF